MKKVLLSWIMGLLFLFACTAHVQAEETVIMISTPEELDAVRENLSGNYQLANDIDMTGYYEIEPIGNETTGAFTGTFDGNGYTIKNLELNYSSYKYVGLFGYLDGIVKNMTLKNVEVVGSRYVGAIAGYADENSEIIGCEVSGSVEGGSAYFYSFVSGIAGTGKGIIKNCTNHADISSETAKEVAGITAGRAVIIENCHNTGRLIGGLNWLFGIGCAETISQCTNEGTLKATNNIFGIGMAAAITECANHGIIDGDEAWVSLGVGEADFITGCYNTGDITGICRVAGIGYESQKFLNCSNSGSVKAVGDRYQDVFAYGIGYSNIESSSNYGNVIANAIVGAGWSTPSSYAYGIGSSNIEKCINTGNVIASEGNGAAYVYGIGRSNIEKCINTGNMSSIENYGYGIGATNINESCDFARKLVKYCYYNGTNVVQFSYKNDGKMRIGSNDDSFDKSKGRESFGKIVNSDALNQLDYQTVYVRNENWNSGLPMIRDIPTHLELNEIYLFLYSGESAQLKGRVGDVEVSNLTFTSDNEEAVTVSSTGLVSAQGGENAFGVVTARTADGYQMNCHVFVYSRKPESVSITNKPSTLRTGQAVQLNAHIEYEMATEDRELTWSSSNSGVAAVSADGLVETKAPGTVTISVSTENGKTDSCTITVTASEMSLDVSELVIIKGKTATLTPILVPANAPDTLTYSSSNTSIATVSTTGLITAKSAGAAVITVNSSGGLSAACTVYVPAMTLNSTTASVNINKTKQLGITLTPAELEQEITWTSADETIAIVDSEGIVTGVSQGTVTITAVSEYGTTASCVVTVTKLANEITLDRTAITLEAGTTDRIGIALNPTDATDTITYTSSNTSAVSVSSTGVLTAKAVGSSLVTVTTSGGLKAYCSVVVNPAPVEATEITLSATELELMQEKSAVLSATVTPTNTTDQEITWSSSDESVATVNQGGTVTAVGSGKATIRAELANGIFATCEVFTSTVVSVENKAGERDETISVPFEIHANAGIASMRLKVEYDSTVLTPVGVNAGDILSGAQINGNMDEAGSYYVLWSQAENMTENGTMFSVDFEVAEGAETGITTEIAVSYTEGDICDEEHNDIAVTTISGEVSILEILLGDVYIDQVLNSHDILLLQQYMTELVSLDSRQMTRADMNSDENVTMQDVVLLAQALVNPSAFSEPASMSVLALTSEASEEFVINLGSVELNEEGYADIPVTFANCPGISAFKFKITYNSEEIELVAVNAVDEAFSGNLMSNLENASLGEAIVTWYSSENVTPDGEVMTLRFTAKAGALTEASAVSMSAEEGDLCDADCETINVTMNAGAVLPMAEEPEPTTPVTEVFSDVEAGSWYIDAVQYVYDNGIMSGNGGLFTPGTAVTRAMVVETLYKMEGKPSVSDYSKYEQYTDLSRENWWSSSVAWALNMGIATGDNFNMLFNPESPVTREQLATFIYRYADYKEYDTSISADISGMQNAAQVSSYADTAVKWAVGTKIISGSESTDAQGNTIYDLNPTGTATRAQLAVILQRFCEVQ